MHARPHRRNLRFRNLFESVRPLAKQDGDISGPEEIFEACFKIGIISKLGITSKRLGKHP